MNRRENNDTMEWIPIYEQLEENEWPVVVAYECSVCWHKSYARYAHCPNCKRREYDPYEGYEQY